MCELCELDLFYSDTLERWEEESVGVDDVMFAYTQDVIELLAEIKRLKARVRKLEDGNRWIPVSERLPEDRQMVFVCTRDRKIHEWLYSTALKSIFTRHILYWKSKLMPEAPESEEE